jgi:hypothetical protein
MASILADTQYSFNEFYNTDTRNTQLEEDTIAKINYLAQKVGAPSYKKTPDFRRHNRQNRADANSGYKRKQKTTPTTNEDWEAVRNFKTTKLEKNTEGIQADIDKIRSHLNRLTKKTYDDVIKNIKQVLNKVVRDQFTAQDNLLQVGNAIFVVGSKNKFWSELYAILYKDLVNQIPIMSNICNQNFDEFKGMFDNIEYISPDEDYNKYCIINKQNEERKGMSNFLTYLMKNNLIEQERMINLIKGLLNMIDEFMNLEGKEKNIEEIAENLHLLVLNGSDVLEKSDGWNDITNKIEEISSLKSSKYPSLTQKTVFKMMDIYDEL